MKTIHLFYNGDEAIFPENNDWEKFPSSLDSVRCFLTCAESWRRNGWNVVRVSTAPVVIPLAQDDLGTYNFHPINFNGRIYREGRWYPERNWQFIAKAHQMARPELNENPPEIVNRGRLLDEFLFGTYDVFNYGFRPEMLPPLDTETECTSFQREHFSMSLIHCNRRWLTLARQLLIDYDNGQLARIPGKYTSDETILRTYARYSILPFQSFPISPDQSQFPLLHFARSTFRGCYEKIPFV